MTTRLSKRASEWNARRTTADAAAGSSDHCAGRDSHHVSHPAQAFDPMVLFSDANI
jgi:hypothetical protein